MLPWAVSCQKRRVGDKKTAEQVLGMPHITLKDVIDVMLSVLYENKEKTQTQYHCYDQSQHRGMESWRKSQGMRIPSDIVYSNAALPTLTNKELKKIIQEI